MNISFQWRFFHSQMQLLAEFYLYKRQDYSYHQGRISTISVSLCSQKEMCRKLVRLGTCAKIDKICTLKFVRDYDTFGIAKWLGKIEAMYSSIVCISADGETIGNTE